MLKVLAFDICLWYNNHRQIFLLEVMVLASVDFFMGTVRGLWKNARPSAGHVGCFFDTGISTIGLTGDVNPVRVSTNKGARLVVGGIYDRDFSGTPVYKIVLAEPVMPKRRLVERLTDLSISKKAAEAVVNEWGFMSYVRLMLEPKDTLLQVAVLSEKEKKAVLKIVERVDGQGFGAMRVMSVFQGFKPEQAQDVYRAYEEQFEAKLRDNFYRLLYELDARWAKRFTTVDAIALANGVAPDSPVRIQEAVRYSVTSELTKSGDTSFCLDDKGIMDKLLFAVNTRCLKTVYLSHQTFEQILTQSQHFVVDKYQGYRVCYPAGFYDAEVFLSENIPARSSQSSRYPGTVSDVRQYIAEYEDITGNQLDTDQYFAVLNALLKPFYIITGGPGSGKTHMLGCILYVWCRTCEAKSVLLDDSSFCLLAPTGKAMKRMESMLNKLCADMDAAVEDEDDKKSLSSFVNSRVESVSTVASFLMRRDNLSGSLIILDEASMVGLTDMAALFRFRSFSEPQIILVGDVDQLPSISPGRVFQDLCEAGEFCQKYKSANPVPYQRLTGNYRSKGAWTMTENNKSVMRGVPFAQMDTSTPSFQFYGFAQENDAYVNKIVELYQYWMSRHYDVADIRVLAAMNKYEAGVDALNLKLQDALNPLCQSPNPVLHGSSKEYSDKGFEIPFLFADGCKVRVGDRVVQLENNYEYNLMNGDVGTVMAFVDNPVRSSILIHLDDGRDVRVDDTAFSCLALGYATTVHKAQGSEYPVVIFSAQIGLAYMNSDFPSRNLLYTAWTRAKEALAIVGSGLSVQKCIDTPVRRRNSLLMNRIVAAV